MRYALGVRGCFWGRRLRSTASAGLPAAEKPACRPTVVRLTDRQPHWKPVGIDDRMNHGATTDLNTVWTRPQVCFRVA
jgi:hypothetical protein